jgi:hypothetical protein
MLQKIKFDQIIKIFCLTSTSTIVKSPHKIETRAVFIESPSNLPTPPPNQIEKFGQGLFVCLLLGELQNFAKPTLPEAYYFVSDARTSAPKFSSAVSERYRCLAPT